jgi:short-subunit dehydrogenase
VSTALITGASAGIGKELARVFAAEGHDLILVARRLSELQALGTELEQQYRIRARALACDLTLESALRDLLVEIHDVDLDYLVNNAGFGTVGTFAELDAEREAAMVALNVTAVVRLTRAVLPGMIARRKGRILNIGSTAGFQPGPYMATYYATKAFVNSFSQALAYEIRGTGVSVTVSCPGPTASEFGALAGLDRSRLFRMGTATSASVAREAYRAMQRGRPMVVHGWRNRVLAQSTRFSPRALLCAITGYLNRSPASGAAR